jgi:nitric oxide reductase NorE protein
MEVSTKVAPEIDYKSISSPPGGVLMWIVIFLEVITFGIGLVGLVYYARQEPELFHESRMQLNTTLGAINTVILLSSGYFMAKAIHAYKKGELFKTISNFKLTIAGGGMFVVIKSYEYFEKLDAGLGMDGNMFFTLYWLLTGFHLVHVVVGMVILAIMMFSIKKSRGNTALEDVEAGGAFWHMCDLIWLLLFPALYLIF